MRDKYQKPLDILKDMLHTAEPYALWLHKPDLYRDNRDCGWLLIII